jgi:hypothetical protein
MEVYGMAYENQTKCIYCGISIPDPEEGAEGTALLCDKCYDELEEEE